LIAAGPPNRPQPDGECHAPKRVPVKRILTGSPAASVVSEGSLADPSALEPFVEISRSPS